MRAKFQVASVSRFADFDGVEVKLRPVIDDYEENKKFWKYTPQGKLEVTITNPNAVEFFEVGKEYYLDFSEATV
ncbi:hypothetical protein [Nostoc sp.]|uniref:hypothetical protein n=1 Tax=Nostoc sp. TaxID=1180 RepID=UPI002FFAF940